MPKSEWEVVGDAGADAGAEEAAPVVVEGAWPDIVRWPDGRDSVLLVALGSGPGARALYGVVDGSVRWALRR